MNQELVVTIVVGHAQFVRVLAAVFLHHVGDTGTEGALDAGQLLKYRVAGRVRRIAQVLLSDFKRTLRQRCARRSAGVHQLIRNLIRTIRILRDLADDYGVNTQRRPGSRLHFLGTGRLLRQTRAIQRIEFTAVAQVSCHDTTDIFRRSALAGPLERYHADRARRVHPLGDLDTYFCVQHRRPQH